MKTIGKLFIGAAIIGLTACSSSEEGGLVLEDVLALTERVEAAEIAAPAELAGSADMTGFVAVSDNLSDDYAIAGTLAITADFDNAEISGTATNFGEYEGSCETAATCEQLSSFDGSLTLDGTIDIATSSLTGTLDGTLSGDYEDEELGNGTFVANFDSDVGGGFLSDDQGLMAIGEIAGEAELQVTIGGQTGSETVQLEGIFAAGE